IEEEQSNPVPGLSHLSIMTQHRFERFVEALKPQGPSLDDRRRCQRRKKLLLQKSYERNEREFTGRDLTITTAVNKLGAAQVRHFFSDVQCGPRIVHLPGAVTACLRKSWAMEDRLTKVCPLVLVEGKRLTKGEIREITHLHHALDAILQGLGATLFPTDGRFWEAFSRRRPERGDRAILQQTGMFQFSSNGAWRLRNLPDDLCRSIEQALWEKRVVMHIPSSMAGMRVQQNAWCVLGANGGKVEIGQHKPREGAGKRGLKIESKKPNRLLGYKPKSESKLNRQKSVLIIEENFGVALSTPP